jgi:SAM-dependent methyltransferase
MSSDIINFYNQYLEAFSIKDPSAVGWTDESTQHKRFKALFGIGISDGDRILDYGCGLGHLNNYIALNGFKSISYVGVDINPNYIAMAKQLYPDDGIFMVGDIESVKVNPGVEYVIGSGVFTYGITLDEVISKIEVAYDLCFRGVAFNFLNKKSGLDGLLMYDPKEITNRLSHIGDVTVVSGYLGDEDFTIYIKKINI